MYCPYCRKQITEDADFCVYCGKRLRYVADESTRSDDRGQYLASDGKKQYVNKKTIIISFLAITLVTIAFFIGIRLGQDKSANKAEAIIPVEEHKADYAHTYLSDDVISKEDGPIVDEPTDNTPDSYKEDYSTNTDTTPDANDINVESIIADIRSKYYSTQNDSSSMHTSKCGNRGTAYYHNGELKKIVISSVNASDYSSEYYYSEGRLYFAFVYRGQEEYRYYFYDNTLIRYINPNKVVMDLDAAEQYYDEADMLKMEAYTYYEMAGNSL